VGRRVNEERTGQYLFACTSPAREPDPTTVSRSAPFIPSEPCVCRRARGWDLEMLWGRRRGDVTIVAVANRWSAPMPPGEALL
jgi:hypothetical protein